MNKSKISGKATLCECFNLILIKIIISKHFSIETIILKNKKKTWEIILFLFYF